MDNEKAPAMDWNSLQVPLAGEKGAFNELFAAAFEERKGGEE